MTEPLSPDGPPPEVADVLAVVFPYDGSTRDAPSRLCAECITRLDVSGAGLILLQGSEQLGVVAVTDGPAARLEELQFTAGEGPGVDASRTGRPVLHPQLRQSAAAMWPGFGPAVLDTGIEAIFAFPLQVGAIRIGSLDLYRDSPGRLTDDEFRSALALADAATLLLMHLHDQPGGGGQQIPLELIDRRAVVHQATGVLSVQLAVGLHEALLRMRAHAYSAERQLPEVAADVLAHRLYLELDPH